ncbi:MAG: NeuD/PglB/VioB family sugar acetyltransferase [Planctomycetes bacterium]|nr:NeuD/PglB/VioB family sugar acetyltransferase [Planctomycetota bacterium]MCB9901533.1 NeuD/PglB/VioB family sugar acetyltransferase [Planctomycetota bacterium]
MRVVLIGARTDGLAQWVLENAREHAGHEVVGFLDETPALQGARVFDLPVLGPPAAAERAIDAGAEGVLFAIGHGPARARMAPGLKEAGLQLVSLVCPGAVIASSAEVGEGVLIGTNAVVSTGTRVEDLAIVLSLSCVGHHAHVGHAATLSGGVLLGGRARIGARTLVGLGAKVMSDVHVGADVTVGAGALVTKDVPDGIRVAGVPAKPLEDPPDQVSPSLP